MCAASSAQAQTACKDLPNVVLGVGGSAGTPFIKALALALAAAGEDLTVVYADPSACVAMNALISDKPFGDSATTTGKYWTAGSTSDQTCTFSLADSTLADWGSMAQEATSCQAVTQLPATVGDYIGPISGFSLIVPQASEQYAITSEALYFIYGFGVGNGHDVEPWTNPATIASRTTSSAAGLLLAKAAGIPLSRALFASNLPAPRDVQQVKTNQGAIDFVTQDAAAVADPDAALGFCSTETVEAKDNPTKVRTLAFQAKGQDCAWFPDSSDTARDKKNLREGRYFLWNPHHIFARKTAQGAFANPNVEKLVNYFTGKTQLPGSKSYLDVVIGNGNVPQCAMQVTRDGDMGPLASYQPDEPCGCYFDDKQGGDHSCTVCSADDGDEDSACPASAPVCRHGFCEVK